VGKQGSPLASVVTSERWFQCRVLRNLQESPHELTKSYVELGAMLGSEKLNARKVLPWIAVEVTHTFSQPTLWLFVCDAVSSTSIALQCAP
jgi:hypothetical protein